VGFAVVILVWLKGESTDPFCSIVPAAIAGAGLTTFAIGLRSPKYNLGWSTSLSLGFALGMAIAMSLLKGTLPAVFAISLPTLGLPLLDIGFIRARAAINGQPFNMRPERMRLYRVLLFRGLSRTKVALLYFCLGGYFCLLAILAEVGFFSGVHNWFVQLLFVLVLAALGAIGPIVFFSVARILMRRQPGEQLPERLDAFGVRICPVSMEDYILSGQPHHVVTSDANAILTSRNDPEYAEILRNAALITPDGFGVVWGARLMNLPIYERVTGVDMVTGICAMAAKKGYRLFILGSAPGVAQTAADKLTEAYPGVIFAGTHHGMILKDPEAMAEAMRQIKEARPHVLFVAMGIPLQEKFISRNLAELGVPVSLGVGGSFDVYSGKYNRAPVYMQRAGLEWLYRVWIDPSRWRRMGYVPKFMVIALRTWIMSFRGPQKPAGDAL